MNFVLAQMRRTEGYDPSVIASLLSRTQRDPLTQALARPVGTDGVLPSELSEEIREYLAAALEQCSKQVADASRRRLTDNGPVHA